MKMKLENSLQKRNAVSAGLILYNALNLSLATKRNYDPSTMIMQTLES